MAKKTKPITLRTSFFELLDLTQTIAADTLSGEPDDAVENISLDVKIIPDRRTKGVYRIYREKPMKETVNRIKQQQKKARVKPDLSYIG